MNHYISIAVMLAVSAFGAPLFADEAEKAADAEKAKELAASVLADFKAGRELLRTGEFHARGRVVHGGEMAEGHMEGELSLYSAFDFAGGKIRFDRTEPFQFKRSPDAPAERIVVTGKFAKSDEATSNWSSLSPRAAQIRKPDDDTVANTRPFDVRILGSGLWHSLSVNTSLEELHGILMSQKIDEAVEEPGSIYRLRWIYGTEGRLRRTMWIDANQGFAPIRLELQSRREMDWAPPKQVSSVTWKQVDGVWVPASLKIEDGLRTLHYRKMELTFEWKQVNKPIGDSTFAASGFDLPKGVIGLDLRFRR